MKKGTVWAALLTMAAGTWTAHRNKKYPIADGFGMVNKVFVPECAASLPLITANNRMRRMRKPVIPPEIRKSVLQIPGGSGQNMQLTVYEPADHHDILPGMVYTHGGGFFFEESWYLHEIAAHYAKEACCKVVFVHYRTSDTDPFPAPFEDCCAAISYVWEHAESLGIDKTRLAIGGDSAGAALAGCCTLWAREEAKIPFCFQLLIYPVIDSRMQTESMRKYPDSPFWNSRLNKRMWEIYLRNGDFGKPYYASPALADSFSNLPPAYIEVEEFDCLHDEGVNYAGYLRDAGVPVQLEDVKGTFHSYDMYIDHPIVKQMLQKRCDALRNALHNN